VFGAAGFADAVTSSMGVAPYARYAHGISRKRFVGFWPIATRARRPHPAEDAIFLVPGLRDRAAAFFRQSFGGQNA
ncbi:MAG: hypothetical protein WBL48_23030, partial [Pseudolabrys sp.]